MGRRRSREHPLARLAPEERREYLRNYRLVVEHGAVLPAILVLDFLGQRRLYPRQVLDEIHDALLRRAEREGLHVPNFLKDRDAPPFQKWVQSVRLVRLLLGEEPSNYPVRGVRRSRYYAGMSKISALNGQTRILLYSNGRRVEVLAHEDFHGDTAKRLYWAHAARGLEKIWPEFRQRLSNVSAEESGAIFRAIFYRLLSQGDSPDFGPGSDLGKELAYYAVVYHMYYNLPKGVFIRKKKELDRKGDRAYQEEYSKISRHHHAARNFTEGVPLYMILAHALQLSTIDRMVLNAIVNRAHSRKQVYTQIRDTRNNIFYFFNRRLPMGRDVARK